MKLITLNIWGGCLEQKLLAFIAAHQDIDIWCLQEVYYAAEGKISTDDRQVSLNILAEMAKVLPQHRYYFKSTVGDIYGNAIFIKKEFQIIAEGEVMIHDNPDYTGQGAAHPRNLQWLTCQLQKQIFTVINVHGLWNGQGKTDTPARISQSQKIKTFSDGIQTSQILCGDFNLRPDTESLAIIEKNLHNLIKEYNVTSTRTSLYPKAEKFADYIFTSKDIRVNTFKVLPDEVSDHSALLLDFSLYSTAH